jgi:hypothetical protein
MRGAVDWPSHDDSVGYAAWHELNQLPPSEGGNVLRETFKRGGVPQTKRVVGQTLPVELQEPFLEDRPLRNALGKLSAGLSAEEMETGRKIASELGQHEAAKTGAGTTVPDMGVTKDVVSGALVAASAGLNSPTLWKTNSLFNRLTKGSVDKTVKEIDEALLDPDKFTALVEKIQKKLDSKVPLNLGEKALVQASMAATRDRKQEK